jgi:hypothetical protein
MLAFSIMFFAGALLCFLLGWANGVRRDKSFLHIPETGVSSLRPPFSPRWGLFSSSGAQRKRS